MRINRITGKFHSGQVVTKRGAYRQIPEQEIFAALLHHASGDWGYLDEFDWQVNDAALEYGDRLFSQYLSKRGLMFFIITKPDRTMTTIMLAEEYTSDSIGFPRQV